MKMNRDIYKPVISVAMTTYNGSSYLREQLDSFSKQKTLPDELIVCDDYSDDDTFEILQGFKRTAPFEVKLFRNSKTLGYNKNFEKAISKTRGDIIFLSDQDDIWFTNKIEYVTQVFKDDNQALLVINDQQLVDKSISRKGKTALKIIKKYGSSNLSFVSGCCTAFHADLKKVILPFPLYIIGYDSWIHKVAHYLSSRVVIGETLQYYRRHENNVSKWIDNKDNGLVLRFIKSLSGMDNNYDTNVYLLRVILNRIYKNSLPLKNSKTNIINRIERDFNAWDERNNLKKYNYAKRIGRILQMIRNGVYKDVLGYKCVVKDLLV